MAITKEEAQRILDRLRGYAEYTDNETLSIDLEDLQEFLNVLPGVVTPQWQYIPPPYQYIPCNHDWQYVYHTNYTNTSYNVGYWKCTKCGCIQYGHMPVYTTPGYSISTSISANSSG